MTEKLLIALNRVSCTKYFMSIEIIPCSVPLLKIAKPDKKQSVANYIVSSQYDTTMRVAGLPRETNDRCFDAANANKSCVRVHGAGGQSSEFPIYPTPRERGIKTLPHVTISPTISLTMTTSTMEINEIVDDGPATRNDIVNDAVVK